jgi:hypothetical protein
VLFELGAGAWGEVGCVWASAGVATEVSSKAARAERPMPLVPELVRVARCATIVFVMS